GGVTVSLFGKKIHNDVWTMKLVDGRAKWTRLDLKDPPSPRYGFFYGYDAEDGLLVVFSGAQGIDPLDPAGDTWLLSVRDDSLAWRKWEGGSPRGRRNGCFVYDPAQKRLFVFGGTADKRSSIPDLCVFDVRPDGRWQIGGAWHGAPHRRTSG